MVVNGNSARSEEDNGIISLNDCYELLALAIIEQAVKDVPSRSSYNFFKSDWFIFLSPWEDIEGEKIFYQAVRNKELGMFNGLWPDSRFSKYNNNFTKEGYYRHG